MDESCFHVMMAKATFECITDRWGIDNGWEDTSEQWHSITPETRQAILAAMGVEDEYGVSGTPRVQVIEAGKSCPWPTGGRLRLEDGAELSINNWLPSDLPPGYHEFHADDSPLPLRLIVAPSQCHLPEPFWGWGAQLYAARSGQSWGIGDLSDLERLARWTNRLNREFQRPERAGTLRDPLILINPLSAAAPTIPQVASPYYPTSRCFLNPLYLRVEKIPGATRLGAKLEGLATAARALNQNRQIDRNRVFRLKQDATRIIWSEFSGDADFDAYCRERGKALEQFAIYCALAERYGGYWPQWPSIYQKPENIAVRQYAKEHERDVRYYQWLQWLLEGQLAQVAKEIPLVQDLPIGFAPGGADAWVWQDLLAKQCTIGAPPDLFAKNGQDWEMPPFVPHKLRAAAYEPFIQAVRAVLRHGGGLRIDHVMGLFRLYWVPQDLGPLRGGYVRYMADELLGIVALESRRAGAFIVGEDLGTVEPRIREELSRRHVLSFRVFWFEKTSPAKYPEMAMAAVTTHDLPTVAGLWTGDDLAAQQAVGQTPTDAFVELFDDFQKRFVASKDPSTVIEKTYQLLATAPSRILLATLDDALAISERPNLPGTVDERPNWSLALPGGLEALEQSASARHIAEILARGVTLADSTEENKC